MDQQLKAEMSRHNQLTSGYINYFRQEQVGLSKYIQEQSINYTKINYVLCDVNKIADLQTKHLSEGYVYA